MQTNSAAIRLATEDGERANEIIRRCVHCGFCNANCPTYRLLGDELDGPRGRIYLIKEMLEANEASQTATTHLDRCLTCRACETTCPSGVEYGELAEIGRRFIANEKPSRLSLLRRALLLIVPRPMVFRWTAWLGWCVRFFLPKRMRQLLHRRPGGSAIRSSPDADIVLLQGCVQRVMTPEVVQHLAKIISARGGAVRTLDRERCCGGLHLHAGLKTEALTMITDNVAQVAAANPSVVISSASGCGVTWKEYDQIAATDTASTASSKTMDVAEYLKQFDFNAAPGPRRVAFQSPCTLQHGQRITNAVEEILSRAGHTLVPVRDSNQCCGSAGSYSILQPEISESLRQKKLKALTEHQPDVIATANVGCQLHLESETSIPVVHWVQLLE